jgi:hypothetical protein
MITNFKIFENIDGSTKKPNYNEGDYVICANDDDIEYLIKKGNKYKVQKIYRSRVSNNWMVKLVGLENETFFSTRFITELENTAKNITYDNKF